MFAGQMQRLHKKWADHTCAFKELQKKKNYTKQRQDISLFLLEVRMKIISSN